MEDKTLLLLGIGLIAVIGFFGLAFLFMMRPRSYTSVISVERDEAGRIANIVEKVRYHD